MEKFKGTPGEWRVDGPDMFGDYNVLHDGDALAVAAVVSNMRPAEEVAANAALVGASKVMLEALAECVRLLVRDNPADGWADAISAGRAALSRALGDAGEG